MRRFESGDLDRIIHTTRRTIVLVMIMRYKRGETAYIIKNNAVVTAVTVKSYRGGFYVVQLAGSRGAIRLRESRLYPTREAATAALPARPKPLQWWPR